MIRFEHALVPVALSLALTLGGCMTGDQVTDSGVKMYVAGDYSGARDHFAAQNSADSDDPYYQFNLADASLKLGQTDRAIALYREVSVSGRGTHPRYILEPHADGANLHDAACDHLRQLSAPDTNCP